MTKPVTFSPLRGVNAHLRDLPLTNAQRRALHLIGSETVLVRDLVLAHVGRSTLRALERRGIVKQLYDRFRATETGLAMLGLTEDQGGDL